MKYIQFTGRLKRSKLKKFAIAATFTKEIPGGYNIITDIKQINSDTEENAISAYKEQSSGQYVEHNLHVRAVCIEIK